MLVPCFFELDEEKAKSQSKDAEITKLCICPTEGDRSAYYEMSQSSIKKNRNSILQLRQENKRLHKKLANALAVSKTGYSIKNVLVSMLSLYFPGCFSLLELWSAGSYSLVYIVTKHFGTKNEKEHLLLDKLR